MRSDRVERVWTTSGESDELKDRSDQHIARKIFHSLGVAIIIALYHILDRQTGLLLLGSVVFFFVPIDFIRRNVPAMNKVALSLFGGIMRKEEEHRFTGVSYLLTGCLIVISLFPTHVVTLSLIMLALGDPVSSLVGTRYGKDKILGNKSLQGTLAGLFICTVATAVYFINFGLMTERIVLVSLLAGIIGALAELIPIGRLDDNLSFPVLSSIMLYVLFLLFGGF